ncbi:hypothetical protein NDU88_004305 [Pleurodeles waltl]|uniref:Uncharacterized protein n=1 Tax=Pleurodeles waltl TaxID=8319 RepID=A0AAV7MX33_PLEWA|nr:hypothetical protein NDU88_004305 [Pleurodeles waltl]
MQGREEHSENTTASPKQCTSSCNSSLAEVEAYPSSNSRCPSVPAKQDQATGTVRVCLEEVNVSADCSLDAKLKEDWPASGEAGAFWQALLSTMDAMLAAIHYQANKQESQVDLLDVLAVHIVSISKKLQALNDLIRAQTNSYTQQVSCQYVSLGDNSPKTIEILNNILTEVRDQAPRSQDGLGWKEGSVHDNYLDKKGSDRENRNSEATCFSQQEENQNSSGCSKYSNTQAIRPIKEEIAGEASNTLAANKVSLTKREKKQQRKAQKKAKVAQQNSIWKSFTKSIGTQGKDPEEKDVGDLDNSSISLTKQTTTQKDNWDNTTHGVSAYRSQPSQQNQALKDIRPSNCSQAGTLAQPEVAQATPGRGS